MFFIFRYLDYYKGKPSGNHQLYKVGSNLSADLICKQYKQASTRVFLSDTVAGGGAKQLTLHLTWSKGKSSPQIRVNTESQVIAIVKGIGNVSW